MTLLTLRPTVAPRLTASSKTGRISLIPATTPATVDKARHLAHLHTKARHLAHLYNKARHLAHLTNKARHLAHFYNKARHLAHLYNKARHLAHFCNKARHLAHLYNRPQHSSKLSKPLLNWMRQPDKCSSNFKKTSCANSRCSTRSGIIMPEKWRPSPQT
jgi:hypothetical protein